MSHYDTLDVPRDATQEQIKKAYRRKAKDHHPDREHGDEDLMKAVQRAYDTLSDPQKRARYDRTGEDGKAPPTKEEVARGIVLAVANQIIESDFDGNIVNEMKRHFRETIKLKRAERPATERKIAKLMARRGAITGPEDNLFIGLFDAKIKALERHLEIDAKEAELADLAVKVLNDYKDLSPDSQDEPKSDLSAFMEAIKAMENSNRSRGKSGAFRDFFSSR